MRRGIVVLSLTLLGVISGVAVGTEVAADADQARPAGPSQDVLPALLLEVRGLRAAMEQMAAAGPRVQLALGRVQLQEQRINNLIRRLDEVRATLGGAQTNYDRLRRDSRILEEALRNPAADGPPVEQLKDQQINSPRSWNGSHRAAARQRRRSRDPRWSSRASRRAGPIDRQRMEALEAALGPR